MKKLLTIIALFTATTVVAGDLPMLGDPSQRLLTPVREKQLGKQFMNHVRANMKIVSDPLLNDYINTLGQQLVSYSVGSGRHFQFFLVDSDQINAFAGPDGYIGVNSGLMLTTTNEAELAAVLAHEIAHVTQSHVSRSMEQSNLMSIPTAGTLLAALILGQVSGDASLTSGVTSAMIAGNVQHQLNFTREFEQEADRVGMKTLHGANYDPAAMPQFFERMQHATAASASDLPEVLRTHPVSASRIADSKNRAAQYPKITRQSELQYQLMMARLQVLSNASPRKAETIFSEKIKQDNTPVNQYGYALALLVNRKPGKATPILKILAQKYPAQTAYQLAFANALADQSSMQVQATKAFQHAYDFNPDYYPAVVEYADNLMTNQQANKARLLLLNHKYTFNNNPLYYFMLATAQGRSGHLVAAYQSRAQGYLMTDRKKAAAIQLHEALKLDSITPEQRDEIQAVLKRIDVKE